MAYAHWVAAILHNGLGRYEEALAAARQASEDTLRAVHLHVGAARADRGRRPQREHATGRRRPRPARGDTGPAGPTSALGIEARSPRAAERRRGRRAPVPRSDRPAGPHPAAPGAGPRAPAVRRVAAPGAPPRRRARAAAHRPRACSRRWASEAFAERARRELRATGETARKRTRRRQDDGADRPGGPDRPAGPRRAVEPGDRRPAVHQPAHRPVPPGQGVRQARHQLAQPAATACCPATPLRPGPANPQDPRRSL